MLYICIAAARGSIPVSTNLRHGCCHWQVQDRLSHSHTFALILRTWGHDQLGSHPLQTVLVIAEPGNKEFVCRLTKGSSLLWKHNSNDAKLCVLQKVVV